MQAAAVYIGEQMGLRRKLVGKMPEPWWKSKIGGYQKTEKGCGHTRKVHEKWT